MWWNNYSWPGDYWPMHFFLGPGMMIVFVIICFALMFFMMRGRRMHASRGGYALDILKERFARGEIDQAEYEERRRLLDA
jgi:putative membrane protein